MTFKYFSLGAEKGDLIFLVRELVHLEDFKVNMNLSDNLSP